MKKRRYYIHRMFRKNLIAKIFSLLLAIGIWIVIRSYTVQNNISEGIHHLIPN